MILLAPMRTLKAHNLTKAKNDVRYYLNGIAFVKDEIWSTSGHVGLRSSNLLNPEIMKNDRIIVSIGRLSTVRGIETAVIDTDAGIVYYIPQVIEKRADLDEIDYKATRLDVATVELVDGNYPDLDRVYPPAQSKAEGVPLISFNAEYLALPMAIGKALGMKFKTTVIAFQGDNTKAATFTLTEPSGSTHQLVIMPVRM